MITTVTLNPALDRTITISRFAAGRVNRVEHTYDRPGGKGINVAASLAANGYAVTAMGFLGLDNQDVFRAFFEQKGIVDCFVRIQGSTRVGLKIVDPVLAETTDINFPGLSPSAEEMVALTSQVEALSGGWCVLAGSLPPGVPAGIYRDLIRSLKLQGVRTVLDTSGDALREALSAGPDLIKPNIHELEAHVGRPLPTEADVLAAAREVISQGTQMVVVSRGSEGAFFITADSFVSIRPPKIAVRSTVGAGDAMVAGLVAAQVSGLPLEATAQLATDFAVRALTATI